MATFTESMIDPQPGKSGGATNSYLYNSSTTATALSSTPAVAKTKSCWTRLVDHLVSPNFATIAIGGAVVLGTLGGMFLKIGLQALILSLATGLGITPIGACIIGGALLLVGVCLLVIAIRSKSSYLKRHTDYAQFLTLVAAYNKAAEDHRAAFEQLANGCDTDLKKSRSKQWQKGTAKNTMDLLQTKTAALKALIPVAAVVSRAEAAYWAGCLTPDLFTEKEETVDGSGA